MLHILKAKIKSSLWGDDMTVIRWMSFASQLTELVVQTEEIRDFLVGFALIELGTDISENISVRLPLRAELAPCLLILPAYEPQH